MRKFLKWTAIIVGGLIGLIVVVSIIGSLFGGGSDSQVNVDPAMTTVNWNTLKNSAERVSYDELFRNNERWEGKQVYYEGKIIQVIEDSGNKYQFRANVTKGEYSWDDDVFLRYSGDRLLEDDIIEFVGRVNGLLTYESIFGQKITIPDITVIQSRRMP